MNLSHLTMWRHAVEPNHSKHQEQNSWVPVLHTDYVKSFQCSHARRQIVVSKCTVHSNAELVAVLKSDHIRFSRYLSIFFGITFVFCSQWAGQIQEYVLMHTISVCNGSIWFDMGSYQNWTGPYIWLTIISETPLPPNRRSWRIGQDSSDVMGDISPSVIASALTAPVKSCWVSELQPISRASSLPSQ